MNKKLIILSILLFFVTMLFCISTVPAITGDDWAYRRTITVDNKIDDYPKQFLVGYNADDDGIVHCNGSCADDFSDLRFTDTDDNLIYHYVLDYTSKENATVWLNNEDNETNFFMYYGNGYKNDINDGYEVFNDYFDDWTSDNTGDWTRRNDGNQFWYSHDTYSQGYGKKLVIDGKIDEWHYSIWGYGWFGFTDSRTTRTDTNDNTALLITEHDRDNVDETDVFNFKILIRKNGVSLSSSYKNISNSYLNENLKIIFYQTNETVGYEIYDENYGLLINDSLNTNIPLTNETKYLVWGMLDSSGLDFTYFSGSDFVRVGDKWGDELYFHIYTWFVSPYRENEPSFSFSEYLGQFESGNGLNDNPYLISNVNHLQNMNYHRGDCVVDACNYFFKVINDINASETANWGRGYEGFNPVGPEVTQPFTGNVNGSGYKISNLHIDRPTEDYVGLFGYIEGGDAVDNDAEIYNLELINCNITGNNQVGGLVGRSLYGEIWECSSNGSVTGNNNVGGLVGANDGMLTHDCFSHADVTGNDAVGGLVGDISYSGLTLARCYSTGLVSGSTDVGGFIGVQTVSCTVNDCFWDNETSNQLSSDGGTGKNTSLMKTKRNYVDVSWSDGLSNPWDFFNNEYDDVSSSDIWGIGGSYPYLRHPFTFHAYFSYSPSFPSVDETINFTDESTGSPLSWSWDFGDGSTSLDQNPSHSYSSNGTYTVTLEASDGAITDTTSKEVTVSSISSSLNANFVYSPDYPSSDEVVHFTDKSTGDINEWHWSFGDGSTSVGKNQEHTYQDEGSYVVRLTVTGVLGDTDSMTKTVIVTDIYDDNKTIRIPPVQPPVNPEGYTIEDMYRLINAFALSDSDSEVTVVVIDSGVDYDYYNNMSFDKITRYHHPFYQTGFDFNGHGNFVNYEIGWILQQKLPNANHISYRAFDEKGESTGQVFIESINAVKKLNPDVVSISAGAFGEKDDAYSSLMDELRSMGIIVVSCASGNYGPSSNTVISPALSPFALAVGACNPEFTISDLTDDTICPWSSRGPVQGVDECKPDVSAPGESIIGPWLRSVKVKSGTSLSTPLLAGGTAVIVGQHKGLIDIVKTLWFWHKSIVPDTFEKALEDSCVLKGECDTWGAGIIQMQETSDLFFWYLLLEIIIPIIIIILIVIGLIWWYHRKEEY